MSGFLDRLKAERDELLDRIVKLDRFRSGDQPPGVSNNHWALLHSQREAMRDYLSILNARLHDLEATSDCDQHTA